LLQFINLYEIIKMIVLSSKFSLNPIKMFRKQISKDDTERRKAIGRQWLFFNFFDIFIDTSRLSDTKK
jgi:hypothetical protein